MNGPVEPGRQRLEQDVLDALVEHRAEDDGHEQEEREARGRVPVEAAEAAGRDRDARARDARHQREDLRDADRERRPDAEAVELAPLRAVRSAIQSRTREDREEDRDLPRLAEVRSRSSPRRAAPAIAAGIVAKNDAPGEALVRRLHAAARATERNHART